MRILSIASLAVMGLAVSVSAHADTVTFASTAGVTAFQEGSVTGVAAPYQNGAYAQPIAGSQWVSTDTNGGDGSVGTVYYTNQFTLLAGETYSGSVSVMADNEAGVEINGVEIYPVNNSTTGFGEPTSINLLSSYFHAGLNTITLEDHNDGGPAAADFAGSLNGVPSAVSATPEPSSLVLLATGMLGAAGTLRSRLRIA